MFQIYGRAEVVVDVLAAKGHQEQRLFEEVHQLCGEASYNIKKKNTCPGSLPGIKVPAITGGTTPGLGTSHTGGTMPGSGTSQTRGPFPSSEVPATTGGSRHVLSTGGHSTHDVPSTVGHSISNQLNYNGSMSLHRKAEEKFISVTVYFKRLPL